VSKFGECNRVTAENATNSKSAAHLPRQPETLIEDEPACRRKYERRRRNFYMDAVGGFSACAGGLPN
jgi:hypothetical protein